MKSSLKIIGRDCGNVAYPRATRISRTGKPQPGFTWCTVNAPFQPAHRFGRIERYSRRPPTCQV